MHITQNELIMLKKLIELKMGIGELYRVYAGKFPDRRQFWSTLASEEMEHANWLLMLQGQIRHGNIRFRKNRFNIWGIEISLNYVKDKLSFAQNNDVPPILALSTALDIEVSLLERKYYEYYESDCKEIKKFCMT